MIVMNKSQNLSAKTERGGNGREITSAALRFPMFHWRKPFQDVAQYG